MITPEHDARSTTASSSSATRFAERQGRVLRRAAAAARAARSPRTSSSTSSARRQRQAARCIQEWARRLGLGAPHRDRHPGRVRGPRPRPRVAQRRLRRVPQVREEGARARRDRRRRCTPAAASSARGRPATTSTSRSARATCRPRRCSSPTAYSAIANGGTRRHARTSARRSRTAPAACVEQIRTPAARRVDFDPGQPAGDHGRPARRRHRARAAPRPTSSRASRIRSTARPAPPSARPAPTSPGTRATSPHPTRPIVVVTTIEQRRLRRGDCGTRGAPDPLRVVPSSTTTQFHAGSARPDERHARRSSRPPSRRPRSSRASGACAWTRCCCSPRSGSSPAR